MNAKLHVPALCCVLGLLAGGHRGPAQEAQHLRRAEQGRYRLGVVMAQVAKPQAIERLDASLDEDADSASAAVAADAVPPPA